MEAQAERYEQILLVDIWRAVWRRKWIFLGTLFVCLLFALILALTLDPYYRAEVVVSPVTDTRDGSALASMAGRLGGITSLIGLPVASNAQAEAIALLKSRALARAFIAENELVPVLYSEHWDEATGGWSAEVAEDPPSISDAVNLFTRSIRKVIEDNKTNMVSLRIEWRDPQQAADWANALIDRINLELRQLSIAEAEKSIKYLQEQAELTSNVDLDKAIYQLVQEQVSRIMLANVREEYGFRVIDPAVAPEENDIAGPNRLAILILGLFGGGIAGLLLVLLREMVD
jgi:uncharacterized protein involved in exopolysaccharide biosynthesis